MITKVVLVRPRGFCAGVARAIDIVERALEIYGAPIYVKHAIVHNVHVVKDLEKKGAIFVETVEEIPKGAKAIFSAHGSPPQQYEAALKRNITIIDAACPLVSKVHIEAKQFAQKGCTIVYVGHRGHVEAIGVEGEVIKVGGLFYLIDNKKEAKKFTSKENTIAILSQTTLSLTDTKEIMEILARKFPNAMYPPRKDICYATENRQQAVKELAVVADTIFILGSKTSSNSNRLQEVAQEQGANAFLVDDVSQIKDTWLTKANIIGISAGASAPEYLVEEMVAFFKDKGVKNVERLEAIKEEVFFPLPQALQNAMQAP